MVINMKNFMKSFIFVFLFNASCGHSDELEQIEINFVSGAKIPEKLENITLSNYLDINVDNVSTYKFENGSIKKYGKMDSKQLNELSVGYKSQPNNLSLGSKKQLFLDDNEFIKVTGVDNNKKLFDGSIIIEFNVLPNFDGFALENGLVFISDLSDINRGVFKIKNLYDLQDKINILEKSSNILSIDLDLIDISTTNN